jgi:DNA-binding NtrC family response regulator
LSDIGASRSLAHLRSALLNPNEKVLPRDWTVKAVTKDGTSVTGRRMNEDTFSVQVLDAEARLAAAFFSKRGYPGLSLAPSTLARLQENPWRGNVRELFNVLERAAIMAEVGAILPEHLLLDDELPSWNRIAAPAAALPGAWPVAEGALPRANQEYAGSRQRSVREMEEQLIFQTLKQANNNRTQTAKLLGISVRTLRNKLKSYRERIQLVEA